MTAGSQVVDWDGRRTDGTMAARGTYTARIHATDGELAIDQATAVVADGFKATVNDATPGRGQTISVSVTTPELLASALRVKVSQPGVPALSVTMTKLSSTAYKVKIKLRSTGRAGTVRLSFSGTDHAGHVNRASRSFVLH